MSKLIRIVLVNLCIIIVIVGVSGLIATYNMAMSWKNFNEEHGCVTIDNGVSYVCKDGIMYWKDND